jgi:hypothetical protein
MDDNNTASQEELEPLKKYLLLQKLEKLKNKLEVHNIESEGLNTFLNFGKEFSYETILSVSDSFVNFFNTQFESNRGENNAE